MIDTYGKYVLVFLDLAGMVGDSAALNNHLDIRGHIANYFCLFLMRYKSITGRLHPRYFQSKFRSVYVFYKIDIPKFNEYHAEVKECLLQFYGFEGNANLEQLFLFKLPFLENWKPITQIFARSRTDLDP